MTRDEIIEVFVVAASVDRKLPNTARPATLKSMNLGAVHSFSEMAQWGSERLHEQAWAWLDPENLRVTRNQVGIWMVSMELIKLVQSDKNRRSLWAWSRSEAKSGSFARWCRKVEGISRQLGDYRKNAAISQIERAFASKPLLHNDKGGFDDFTNEPEIGDKASSIEVWRAEDARPLRCDFDTDIAGLEWSAIQNSRRRERTERRNKAA